MKKNILIISNPFGFGPAGKAIAVANKLLSLEIKNFDVTFLTDNLSGEIVDKNIKHLRVDTRNEKNLRKTFGNFNNPYIISSQNRFSIKVAQESLLPNVFIDGLAWLWNPVPPEHLIADRIYWPRMPWLDKKPNNKRVKIINPIVGDLGINIKSSKSAVRNQILISLGGIINPLTKEFPYLYLDLFCKMINKAEIKERLIIVSSKGICEYIKKKINRNDTIIDSLQREEFLKELSLSKKYVTNGGQTGILEAIKLQKPIGFILPSNLSQYQLIKQFTKYNLVKDAPLWRNFIDFNYPKMMSEKKYLNELSNWTDKLLSNSRQLEKYVLFQQNVIKKGDRNIKKSLFFHKNGDGAQDILDDLTNIWKL